MKRCILTSFLLISLSFPVCANEMIDDFYDIARNFYDAGQYQESKDYIKQILSVNPKHYGANYLMIKMTPPENFLSDTSLTSKIIVRPINISTNNKTSDNYNRQGQLLYKQQDYTKAENYFNTAIKNNPQNQYAYNNLGLTYWKQAEYKKAEEAFKKANKINPSFTAPLVNLSQMLISNCDYSKVPKYLNLAIQKNKNDYSAYYLLGVYYKIQGNYQEAIKFLNCAAQIKPQFNITYLQLGDIYYWTKDYSWSNSSIERYIETSPSDDYAYFMLHRNYMMLKNYELAKNYMIKAIMINNCIDYRIALAGVENALENPKGAIDALKTIQEPTGEILNEMGQYYLSLKDYNNALICFQNAATKPGARPIYFYNVAIVYKNINDTENYNKMINALEAMVPMTCQDFIDLSGIFLDYAGKNKAIETLNKGLKLYPKNKAIYNAKLRIYNITSDKIGEEKIQREIDRIFK